MNTVLVVDDNSMIRKSIIFRVNWEEMNMKVIGEAGNGEDAFNKICALKPDIVITDIRMPKSDGFSIIEKTKEILPHIQYIIISGYDDFKYTKKAILYKVVTYILKPINNEELISALNTAKNNIVEYNNQHKNNLNEHINKYFISFFNNNIPYNTFIKLINEKGINFNYKHFAMISINIVNCDNDTNLYSHGNIFIDFESFLSSHFYKSDFKIITLNKNLFCILINTEYTSISELFLNKIYSYILIYFNFSNEFTKIFLGYSKNYNNINMLKNIYKESIYALYYRFIKNEHKTICTYVANTTNYTFNHTFEEELKISFKLGLSEEVNNNISSLLHNSVKNNMGPIEFKHLVNNIINIIENTVVYNKLDSHLIDEIFFNKYFILNFYNLSHLIKFLKETCNKICTLISENSSSNLGDLIVQYVNTNYTKPININSIANTFHLNQIYLGQLFKKQTGLTFNKYINQLKIQHAKKIIEHNNTIKLSDLSNSLGYVDSHYFSKVFKHITGITPSEYRELK